MNYFSAFLDVGTNKNLCMSKGLYYTKECLRLGQSVMRTMTLGSMIFAGYKLPSWLSSLDLCLPSLGLQHSVLSTTITCVGTQFTAVFPKLWASSQMMLWEEILHSSQLIFEL